MFRQSNTSNRLFGILLLLILFFIVGPNSLPNLISRIPFADEGVPCSRLPTANNRGTHQSLIGRISDDPISLEVRVDPIPRTPEGTWVIRIAVINNSIGTVPILYNPNQVIIGDNGTSGLGLIFDPANTLSTGAVRQNQGLTSFPESDIRLLGPRQRCIHRVSFPASQLDPAVASGSAQVRAYYRISSPGAVVQPPNTTATPTYTDQGLRALNGYVESARVLIPLDNAAN